MELYDENLLLLRNAIIERAVDDYKNCVIRGDGYSYRNIQELEAFFKSEYCATLLGNTSTSGTEILERLHEWRKQTEKAKRVKRPYRLRNENKPRKN